jgi:CelD/BcsL family acetyltransferase involved in cellulose biosynthesis
MSRFTHFVLEETGALHALEDAWNQLWSRMRPPSPMMEYRWVRAWWELHQHEGKLLVIVLRDAEGQPVALAPLYIRRDTRDPLSVLRTVHLLGTGEREADEVASEYLGWLAPPALVDTMTSAVATVLRDRAATWDRVRLSNIDGEQDLGRLPEALGTMVRAARVDTRPTFRIAVRPLEEYIAGLTSSNFRHRCRRALRAGAEAGVELVTASDAEQAQELFAVLTRLHQQRWSQRGQPGAFDSAVFCDFHARLLPKYLGDGTAWLAGLRCGDHWLAARYHLRVGDRVFDYVSGVDTTHAPALGPGLLLTLLGLQWCAEHGIRTYDLLAGDYEYKRKLATDTGEIVEVDFFGSSLTAQLWLAARSLRARLRTFAGTTKAAPAAAE